MSPRRVVHVLDTADPGGTAICRIVESLASGIDPARYQIHACFLQQGPFSEHFRRAGIPSTCVEWSGSATDLAGAARYARLLRKGRFSILHQHTGGRLLTGMGRWLTGARVVRTLHFRAIESTGQVPAKFSLPERDALIAVSRVEGIEFGAHSRTHPHLPRLSAAELAEEVSGSKSDLAAVLGHAPASFAYPYGDYNDAVREAVQSGFQVAFSVEEGLNDSSTDPHLLRRSYIGPSDSLTEFALCVRRGGIGRLRDWRVKLALRTRIRRALGRG